MVQINFALREVNVKLVYYGPGRCGKTTNLQIIHAKAPKGSIGEMMSIATETDRTLFFDFLPIKIERVGDATVRLALYTVPGQVFYNNIRKQLLNNNIHSLFHKKICQISACYMSHCLVLSRTKITQHLYYIVYRNTHCIANAISHLQPDCRFSNSGVSAYYYHNMRFKKIGSRIFHNQFVPS